MNAFERVVATVLEHQGYWVRPSYNVSLTREDKHAIGRPSSPRWEIDLIAYKGGPNELLLVECKSYLDSGGVSMAPFDGRNPRFAQRFKLFTDNELRRTVERRLVHQLRLAKACASRPRVSWCLAAGKFTSDVEREGEETLRIARLALWDPEWIAKRLGGIADAGYENDVTSIVAKRLQPQRRHRGGHLVNRSDDE